MAASRRTAAAAGGGAAAAAMPLLVLSLLLAFLAAGTEAFVVGPAATRAVVAGPRTGHRLHMTAGPSSQGTKQQQTPASQQQALRAQGKRALATASALLLGGSGLASPLPWSPVPEARAADISGLPTEVREAFAAARNTEDPFLLRDAIKQLSEYSGLDELAFEDSARRAVNSELKELQRAKPGLWEAETSYYGGVVRRTVNPFHVIELIPLLKAGPFIGGLGYVVAILVQRKFPSLFALAYFGAIASLVGPAVFLILNT